MEKHVPAELNMHDVQYDSLLTYLKETQQKTKLAKNFLSDSTSTEHFARQTIDYVNDTQ